MNENIIYVTVPEEYDLERIDRFLASSLESQASRSLIQKLIRDGLILVNGAATRSNYKVKTDDEISVSFPEEEVRLPFPQDIPVEIIYEDDSIAVINKQPGLVVHQGPGNYDSTLVNALLFHVKTLSTAGDKFRPGLVHRLDRDTAGLMVIAKTDQAYESLVEQFSAREVDKRYAAIVIGKPVKEHDVIEKPIARHKKYRQKMCVTEDGREAVTEYRIEKIWHTPTGTFTLLDVKIYTGRTHQIRVHMSSMGNPVIGDQIYSKRWEKYRVPYLLLASKYLAFRHPVTGERMEFSIDMPEHIMEFIKRLEQRVDQ
ncbi:MAG TPA: RluA family pseudouridine synthase [Spirochaetota bacterium]|nr:RluA family pseudouridine synthase [Spirochaetota bacterium]